MKTVDVSPSEPLKTGRRYLEFIKGYTLLNDFVWHESERKWILHFRIKTDITSSDRIPNPSDWFALVENDYPLGSISIYPSNENGIQATFPHQLFNEQNADLRPWLTGLVCVRTPLRNFGRRTIDREEPTTAERLHWHVTRLLGWIKAAFDGCLFQNGEDFELPQFPYDKSFVRIVFYENPETFVEWRSSCEKSGIATISLPNNVKNRKVGYLTTFADSNNLQISTRDYGMHFDQKNSTSFHALWCLLDSHPFVLPWKAPSTIRELISVCADQAVNILDLVIKNAHNIFSEKLHILLLGYPIPTRFGESASRIHWSACRLQLPKDVLPGFRTTLKNYRTCVGYAYQNTNKRIFWDFTENWSPDQLSTRSRFENSLLLKKIAVVGVGVLGSHVAELLVRGGASNLLLVDGDFIESGNLCRHSLGISDIGENKAVALSSKLNQTIPHCNTLAIPKRLQELTEDDNNVLSANDLVIDCSASDDVLHHLKTVAFKPDTLICSISSSPFGKRLYYYTTPVSLYSIDSFQDSIQSFIDADLREYPPDTYPWQGLGCWSPVFPGRMDQYSTIASLAVQQLHNDLEKPVFPSRVLVFERCEKDGDVESISCVEEKVIE